jgi:hypothetical protein
MSENMDNSKENLKMSKLRENAGPNDRDLWLAVNISAEDCELCIKNAYKDWGRFCVCGNPDQEILPEDINKIQITPKKNARICACGTPGTPSGTDGYFDIYDGDIEVVRYSWDCPASRPQNKSEFYRKSTHHMDSFNPGSISSGPIGEVTIKVRRLPK